MKHLQAFSASCADEYMAVEQLARKINEYFGNDMDVVKDVSHTVTKECGVYTASALVLIETGK